MSDQAVDPPLPVIAGAMIVGTAAMMITGIVPVLLGGLTQAHRLTEAQLGPLATVEVLALALSSAVGPALMQAGSMRLKTVALSLLLMGINLGVCVTQSVVVLFAMRGAAGVLEGLMMGATIVVTVHSRHPDRLNAIFWALSTIPMALMAYLLPVWIVPRWGANGGFAALALLSLISAGAALFLVDRVPPAAPEATAVPLRSRAIMIAFAAIFLQNAAIGGAWAYLQLLAEQHHFPPEVPGIAVSVGLLIQVASALAAAAWGGRLEFRLTLLVGSLSQAVLIAVLAAADTPALYIGAALLFSLFWLALIPFQIRLMIDLDPTRRAALALTAFGLVGLSIGPSLSAFGVDGPNVAGAFWIAAGLMAMASAVFAWLRFGRRPPV